VESIYLAVLILVTIGNWKPIEIPEPVKLGLLQNPVLSQKNPKNSQRNKTPKNNKTHQVVIFLTTGFFATLQ